MLIKDEAPLTPVYREEIFQEYINKVRERIPTDDTRRLMTPPICLSTLVIKFNKLRNDCMFGSATAEQIQEQALQFAADLFIFTDVVKESALMQTVLQGMSKVNISGEKNATSNGSEDKGSM